MKYCILVILNCLLLVVTASAELITYPAPVDPSVEENTNFEVRVRKPGGIWTKIFVYDSQVMRSDTALPGNKLRLITGHMGFTYFDFSGSVELSIISKRVGITTAGIRPVSLGIGRQISGDTVFITLSKPAKFSVEVNGNKYNNLLIFANPIDPLRHLPKYSRAKFHYFGPGPVHQWALNNTLQNGDTVYIDGGAVVRGNIFLSNKSNIKIMGRGILDGSQNSHRFWGKEVTVIDQDRSTTRIIADTGKLRERLVVMKDCVGILIDGITLMNSPSWNFNPIRCRYLTVRNVKILGYYFNTDGIDPVACSNVVIDNIFSRTGDDQISIKNRVAGTDTVGGMFCGNIVVKNATFWPDKGRSMFVGPEALDGASFQNIQFDSINILECKQKLVSNYGCMVVGAADNATIEQIHFSNINIERFTKGNIFSIRVGKWDNTNFAPGNLIRYVTFNNIRYTGAVTPSNARIIGYSATRNISWVNINNFRINGALVTSLTTGNIDTAFASNISFNTVP